MTAPKVELLLRLHRSLPGCFIAVPSLRIGLPMTCASNWKRRFHGNGSGHSSAGRVSEQRRDAGSPPLQRLLPKTAATAQVDFRSANRCSAQRCQSGLTRPQWPKSWSNPRLPTHANHQLGATSELDIGYEMLGGAFLVSYSAGEPVSD